VSWTKRARSTKRRWRSARAASGGAADVAEALQSLEAALAEATNAGFLPFQLEARLALGEIELASGKAEQGRTRLQALEREASARGYALIARKAARALAKP
jgi:hypothetical protein